MPTRPPKTGLPPRGGFDHKVLLGHYEQKIEDFLPTSTPFGLGQNGWLYGTLRDEDDNIYVILRTLSGAEWTGNLRLQTNRDHEQIEMRPETFRTYKGEILIEHDAESVTWRSGTSPSLSGAPEAKDAIFDFEYRQTLDGATWREGDIVDLRAKLMRPGMQWYDPSLEMHGFYGLNVHQAEGTILGKRVRGWYGYDFVNHPAGTRWGTAPYFTRIEVAYHSFANEYDDGSVEVGMICYGNEGWTFAIGSDGENPLFCETKVDAQIVQKANGYPSEILYTFGDWRWHWQADPRGELADHEPDGFPYRASEGRSQRVGDPRRIVSAHAWIDFFDDGRATHALVDKLDL
jgi:hypothetical protein